MKHRKMMKVAWLNSNEKRCSLSERL